MPPVALWLLLCPLSQELADAVQRGDALVARLKAFVASITGKHCSISDSAINATGGISVKYGIRGMVLDRA